MPIIYIAFAEFPAEVNFLAVIAQVWEINQPAIDTLNHHTAFIHTPDNIYQPFHFCRESAAAVGARTTQVLVIVNIITFVIKLAFLRHHFFYQRPDTIQLFVRFFKCKVYFVLVLHTFLLFS